MVVIYGDKKISSFGIYDGHVYTENTAEEMATAVVEIVSRETEVCFWDMSAYYTDISQALYVGGFSFISGNPRIKEMREGEVKYLIAQRGSEKVAYNFTAKLKKRAHRIFNATLICGVKSEGDVDAAFGCGAGTVESVTKSIYALVCVVWEGTTSKSRPMTIGSKAFSSCKKSIGGFWELKAILQDQNKMQVPWDKKTTSEDWLRPAYHGGLLGIAPHAVNRTLDGGASYDVNSMYPWVMKTRPLPYGVGHFEKGEPSQKVLRDVKDGFICIFVKFVASFKLKENGIPCVKVDDLLHVPEWMETSAKVNRLTGEVREDKKGVELTLAYPDFLDFKENYTFILKKWIGYAWWPASTSLFKGFVDGWYGKKKVAQSPGARLFAKLMLNNVSGKLAAIPWVRNLNLMVVDGAVYEEIVKVKAETPSYVHIGAYVTSWARHELIRAIKANRGAVVYYDTDCIHIDGPFVEDITVGDELGQWKKEKEWDSICHIARKQYAFISGGKLDLTLAGHSEEGKAQIQRAYKADGDPLLCEDFEPLPEAEAEAITRRFDGEHDDGDLDIYAKFGQKESECERLVRRLKEKGLEGIRGCAVKETFYKSGEIFEKIPKKEEIFI